MKTKRLFALLLSAMLLLGVFTPLGMIFARAEEPFTTTPMVSGGGGHSLALKYDGTVWAWGSNSYGQLGDGTDTDSNVPVQVQGLTGIIAVSAGEAHSLAVKTTARFGPGAAMIVVNWAWASMAGPSQAAMCL